MSSSASFEEPNVKRSDENESGMCKNVFQYDEIDFIKSTYYPNVSLTMGTINFTDEKKYPCWMIVMVKGNGDREIWLRVIDLYNYIIGCSYSQKFLKEIIPKFWIRKLWEFKVYPDEDFDYNALFIHQNGLKELMEKTNSRQHQIDQSIYLPNCHPDETLQDNEIYKFRNFTLTKIIYDNNNNVRFDCWILINKYSSNGIEFWFKAVDMATFLGFKNPEGALQIYIPFYFKRPLSRFGILKIDTLNYATRFDFYNVWDKTIFIHENGLYSLIRRSKNPEAQHLYDWINCNVLPTLKSM